LTTAKGEVEAVSEPHTEQQLFCDCIQKSKRG